jgi:hypothetical protein
VPFDFSTYRWSAQPWKHAWLNFLGRQKINSTTIRHEEIDMSASFKVGDAVRWNSEAGEIHGTVVKVHTRDTEFMGRHRPASKDSPQYEVKSDKTGHLAMHHGDALKRDN